MQKIKKIWKMAVLITAVFLLVSVEGCKNVAEDSGVSTSVAPQGGGGGGNTNSDFSTFTISPLTVKVGDSQNLVINIAPSDGVTFEATSSDAGKASVTVNGNKVTVTGENTGNTTVSVTAKKNGYNNKSVTANITVESNVAPPVNITFESGYYIAHSSSTWSAMINVTPPQAGQRTAGFTITETMAKGGYTFKGWVVKSSYNPNAASYNQQQIITEYPSTASTLVGIWQENAPNTYSLSYNWGDGVTGVSSTLPSAQNNIVSGRQVTVEIPTNVTRAGYRFLGWSRTANASTAEYTSSNKQITIAQNTMLYAVWEQLYTLSYNWGSGVTVSQGTLPSARNNIVYNTSVTVEVPGNVTRTGYKFLGWSKTANASTATYTSSNKQITITQNTVLYAVWKQLLTYSLSYSWGEGVTDVQGILPSAQTVVYDDPVVRAKEVTVEIPTYVGREGYKFLGWSEAPGASSAHYNSRNNQISMTRDIVLYAVWESAITYSLSYSWGRRVTGVEVQGILPSAQTVAYGEKVIIEIPTDITSTKYKFLGWSKYEMSNEPTYTSTTNNQIIISSDTVLYAVWERIYSLSYSWGEGVTDVQGTLPAAQYNLAYDTEVIVEIPTDVTRTGYKFLGWNTYANAQTARPPSDLYVYSDVVMYAVWVRTYNLSYSWGSGVTGVQGTLPSTQTDIAEGALLDVEIPTNVTRAGYAFLGWSEKSDAIVPYYNSGTTEIKIDRNKILYAVWIACTTNRVGMKMINITGGRAWLTDDYGPTISSFSMSETEITQKQWKDVVGNDGYGEYKPSDELGKGDNYPMYDVSWYDAIVFCNKLSIREGKTPCYALNGDKNAITNGTPPNTDNSVWNKVTCDWNANGYRLPTEAEWEYAARGGNAYEYRELSGGWGAAWCYENRDGKVHEVNTRPKNTNPIKDMSGNVEEWCWDWAGEYSTDQLLNPTGVTSGSRGRMVRGGDVLSSENECAVNYRPIGLSNKVVGSSPERRGSLCGFRVVCRP